MSEESEQAISDTVDEFVDSLDTDKIKAEAERLGVTPAVLLQRIHTEVLVRIWDDA